VPAAIPRVVVPALAALVVALAVPLSAPAQQPPPIDPDALDEGLYVIVEATHRPLDGALVMRPTCKIRRRPVCAAIRTVMTNDLRLSGVVRALDLPAGKVASLRRSPVPRFDVKRAAAAKAGVTWAIGVLAGKGPSKGTIAIKLQVLNVKTGKVLELGRHGTITGPLSKLRTLAHRASNVVFGGLTGVMGSFDGQVFYSGPGPGCARCIWMVDSDGYNARIVVGDDSIHMLPRPSRDLGVLYTSFRGDLPSLFRLTGPGVDKLWAVSANVLTPVTAAAKGKRGRRGKRGKKSRRKLKVAAAPPRPGNPRLLMVGRGPKLPKAALKPYASHEDLQFRTAAQAPDGRIIATINDGEQADLWLLGPTGKPVRNLTNHEADDLDPSWSPDGKMIAFVSNRTGRPQIYVVRTDGTGLERMTFAGPYNTGPDWGAGGKIVYSGLRGGAVDILTVDSAKQMQRLTPGKGRRSLEPSWAPCGRRVVYVSDEDGGGPRLWIASGDGAVREPLALPAGRYYTPVWRKKPGVRPTPFRP